MFEIIQIKQSRFTLYIQDGWNKMDISFILINLFYFAFKAFYNHSSVAELEKPVYMILLDMVLLSFCFFKIMFFMRIFENFG